MAKKISGHLIEIVAHSCNTNITLLKSIVWPQRNLPREVRPFTLSSMLAEEPLIKTFINPLTCRYTSTEIRKDGISRYLNSNCYKANKFIRWLKTV